MNKATLTKNTCRVICLACKARAIGLISRHDELVFRFAREHWAEHDAVEFPDLPNNMRNYYRRMFKGKPFRLKFISVTVT